MPMIDTQTFMPPGLPVEGPQSGAPARGAEGAGASSVTLDSASLLATSSDKSQALASIGLPPPRTEAGNLADAVAALKGLSESSGADIYAIMALFSKIAQEQRNAARQERTASLQGQESALRAAADKIKEAAEERFKGALAQGICQIAAGGFSVAMGGISMGAGMTSASQTTAASKLSGKTFDKGVAQGKSDIAAQMSAQWAAADLTKSAQTAGAVGNSSQLLGQGGGQIIGGIGSIIQASYDRKAGEADAARAQLEADAKMLETGVQMANDMMQRMQEIIGDIRDKLGAIEQSRIETNRGIARNV